MADIVITAEHTYRHDLDSDMLAELGHDIEQLDPSLEVETSIIAQKDFDPELIARISIWISTAAKYIGYAELIARAITFTRRVLAKDNDHEHPIRVDILGPDGRPISSVLVKNPVAEPEDITDDIRQQPSPRRPPDLSR